MGATLVYNQNLGSLSIPDGLLIDVLTQQAGQLVAGSINEVDFVGTASWGQFNVANTISTPSAIKTTIGVPQVQATDLATMVQIALNAGVQTVQTVRVGNGSQVAAVLSVLGGGVVINPPVLNAPTPATTGGTLAIGVYKYVLTAINALGETVASNEVSATTTTNASTVTNTWTAVTGATGYKLYRTAVGGASGSELLLSTGTLGVVVTFTDTGSGTLGTASPPTVNTTGTPAAINTLTALYPGSAMNPAAVSGVAAVAPATATLTYSAGTPIALQTTGPNASKVYLDLTIQTPLGTEVYQNLDGNVFSGTYKIDPTALSNAITAAVNNGTTLRGPSQFFVSSVPAGVATAGAAIIGTPNPLITQGTDGLPFANNAAMDAAMLGSNVSSPYTGMYAFSGQISGGVLALVGNSDVASIAGTALAFAKANNAHFVQSYPQGTASTGSGSAIDLKATAALADWSLSIFNGDWPEIIDANNGGIYRFVDPAPLAAIQYAITAPPRSPANLAFPFIIGTTRVTANGSNNVPYGAGEELALENAGVNYWTNQTAGSSGFAIAHNKNSLGKNFGTTGNIAYGRNLQFAILAFNSPVVGQIVGGDQGFDGADDTQRAAARALFNTLISGWQTDGIFDGTVPQVICDLTNNAPGKGMLRVDIYLQQREIIDIVAVGLMSGVGPLVNVTPQTA